MKTFIINFLVVNFIFSLSVFAQTTDPNAQQLLNKSSHNFFIENKGQWPKEVLYLAKIGGMNAWITNKGIVSDYYQITRNYKPEETMRMPKNEKDEFERKHTSIKGQVVDMFLEGANTEAKSIPSGMQSSGYYNYFIGNDSTKWASYVRLYSEVLIQDIYPEIDIRYYFDNGLIRYDYIAKPRAELSQINLKIDGSNGYKINEKRELTLKTCLGKITHGKLFSYQQIGNSKTEIACSFVKNKNGQIGVIAENYNRDLALVVDPLIYSTFIGGSDNDYGTSIAIDGSGNAYIAGTTHSTDYPTTTGSYQKSPKNTNSNNAFLTKLNSSGSALIFSTYLGGSGGTDGGAYGYSLAIDNSGNSYITGGTTSIDYPTTTGAFQTVLKGSQNVFLTKLNSSGSALIFSTYIGGSGSSNGGDCSSSLAIDNIGNTYITGSTYSRNYPTTAGAFQTSLKGIQNVFVTKFNAMGTALVFSTYIGGSSSYGDGASSLAIDNSGNTYITGTASSTDYPTTTGAFQTSIKPTITNINSNAFVTKLNSSGSALVYSTFIGGHGYYGDAASSIAIDGNDNAYITGISCSYDFPITTGAFQTTLKGQYGNVFVTKLNSTGSSLIYSTFIGGSGSSSSGNYTGGDYGNSIKLDVNGNVYITGYTSSTDFPVTIGAIQTSLKCLSTVFMTKLNSSGSDIIYSTYIGGSGNSYGNGDCGNSLATDGSGYVYITGNTSSNDFPITTGSYQTSLKAIANAFVTMLLIPSQSSINKYTTKDETNISVYPNPFKESTTVKMNESFAKEGYTYRLYDCTGKIILTKPHQTNPEINIQKGELSKGIYFLEIDGNSILRAKLMIGE